MNEVMKDGEPRFVAEYEVFDCVHEHVSEQEGRPVHPSGRVAVVQVCDDCGRVLGQVGWDSV